MSVEDSTQKSEGTRTALIENKDAGMTQDEMIADLIPEQLKEGFLILQDIMKIGGFFLDKPDATAEGMQDYYEVITTPMWFNEIKQKFVRKEYNQLPEFVADVRLLLVNCYRFFGPNDIHTEEALHVEELLEQRIALLPDETRNRCLQKETSAKINHEHNDEDQEQGGSKFTSKLLRSVKGERECRESDKKLEMIEQQRKRKQEEMNADETESAGVAEEDLMCYEVMPDEETLMDGLSSYKPGEGKRKKRMKTTLKELQKIKRRLFKPD